MQPNRESPCGRYDHPIIVAVINEASRERTKLPHGTLGQDALAIMPVASRRPLRLRTSTNNTTNADNDDDELLAA